MVWWLLSKLSTQLAVFKTEKWRYTHACKFLQSLEWCKKKNIETRQPMQMWQIKRLIHWHTLDREMLIANG